NISQQPNETSIQNPVGKYVDIKNYLEDVTRQFLQIKLVLKVLHATNQFKLFTSNATSQFKLFASNTTSQFKLFAFNATSQFKLFASNATSQFKLFVFNTK
ncbi:45340_t:CDS:2, partial [Gigaspora margarita]